MDVTVVVETRFSRTPDGAIWTVTAFGCQFWERYLPIFDNIRVVARIIDVAEPPNGATRADMKCVFFYPLPYYVGPRGYLFKREELRNAIRSAPRPNDAIIVRVTSPIAAQLTSQLIRTGRPYGAEVISDPYDVYAPGAIKHPLRPFFRRWFMRQLREQVQHAVGVGYNTAWAQQQRYPCPNFTTYFPGIRLEDDGFVSHPRRWDTPPCPTTVIFVGSLEQMYKAPDTLIDAVGACIREGLNLRLVLLGDGRHRPELEARASSLGIDDRVYFMGKVAMGDAVRQQLDAADLFVLASRADTVPKAMIEAMARGLPCIGSTIGGFPELLSQEDLVPAGDAAALAEKIRVFVTDPVRMTTTSARNLAKAQEYREEILRGRRDALYAHVREMTEIWLTRRTIRS